MGENPYGEYPYWIKVAKKSSGGVETSELSFSNQLI